MNCPVKLSNTLVMNKYLWMGRQLRHFNDIGSIINWVNAMHQVKGLLLEPDTATLTPANPPSTSTTPVQSLHCPSQHNLSTNTNSSTAKSLFSMHSTRSITPPTTVCFKPERVKPLTPSPPRSSSYEPCKPTPLTTYTLCLPTIAPDDSNPQCPKRRKLSIPPSVDYNAASETTHPEGYKSPVAGMHFWHGPYLQDSQHDYCAWNKLTVLKNT